MAKFSNTDNQDAHLNNIKNNATRLCICEAEPTSFSIATTEGTSMLAITTISGSNFTGPSTVSLVRRLVSIANNAIEVLHTGDAIYVALVNFVGEKVLYYTTCTSQTLTDGNTVNVPAFNIDITNAPA
jgi:hypothetical protein